MVCPLGRAVAFQVAQGVELRLVPVGGCLLVPAVAYRLVPVEGCLLGQGEGCREAPAEAFRLVPVEGCLLGQEEGFQRGRVVVCLQVPRRTTATCRHEGCTWSTCVLTATAPNTACSRMPGLYR